LSDKTSYKNFPPLFLSGSEWEVTIDDTLRVFERCKQNGVEDVVCEISPSGLHVLECFANFGVPESIDLIQKEAKFILEHCKLDSSE